MINLFLDDVKKSYEDKNVLNGITISFESRKGTIIGVIGKNGAGKSTLFKILSQIDKSHQGQFKASTIEQIRLGFLPEDRSLAKLGSIHDILILWARIQGVPTKNIQSNVQSWLCRIGLWDNRNKNISSLSKGNQQKLQLACALIHEPNLIIFDEPFSGLDPSNQELVIEILEVFKNKGALIFLSAHQLELIERIADQCFLLTDGKLEVIQSTIGVSGNQLIIECCEPDLIEGIPVVYLKDSEYFIEVDKLNYQHKNDLFELFSNQSIKVVQTQSLRNVFLQKTSAGL